jgi:hypothetical protein
MAFVSTLGLLAELVGGFLLSIELLWSVEGFINAAKRFKRWLFHESARAVAKAAMVGALVGLVFSPFVVDPFTWIDLLYVPIIAFGGSVVTVMVFPAVLVCAYAVGWVLVLVLRLIEGGELRAGEAPSREAQEKRVGKFGFAILMVGFVLQWWVDLRQTST